MNEEHRATTVEFVENRIEPLVTQVHAVEIGQHDDAVELERVECVGDLFERTVDIGKWQAGEAAKTAAMLPDGARGELVDRSCEDARVRVHFADAWEFVGFAKEQKLDLDFNTPPQRPEPTTAATTKP